MNQQGHTTRKLSYRKDDRAMRRMGAQKIFGSPWVRPWLLFTKLLMGLFVPIERINVHAKLEVRSFTRSWDSMGTPQKMAVPGYAHAPFSLIFNGLLLGWTHWMYWPNLKSVAFPAPEIIRGTRKNWTVPGYAHAPFSPKFLMGFCSDGPSECTGQIWS